ncbi:MAG: hypothetical protein WDW38_004872 [Sanguina aurantia]
MPSLPSRQQQSNINPPSLPILPLFTQVRQVFDELTAELHSGKAQGQAQRIQMLQLRCMTPLDQIMDESLTLLPWGSVCSNRVSKAAALSVSAEHRLIITSLAAMICQVTWCLHRLVDTAPFNQPQFQTYTHLLYISLELVNILPEDWPREQYLPGSIQLCTALDALITWHVKISRSPVSKSAHRSNPARLLKEYCPTLVASILKVTLRCFTDIKCQPSSEACRTFSQLPAGFLPRLCCQACEQFGDDMVPPYKPCQYICSWATLERLLAIAWSCFDCGSSGSSDTGIPTENDAALASLCLAPRF